MRFSKAVAGLAVALILSGGAALAGDASWKYSDGTRLKIKCRTAGCTAKAKKPGGDWVLVEEGPGGNKNFVVLEAKYKKAKPVL